ncbi:Acetyltransferase (GNAT) family protein [Nocardioides sp. YR527]|uniref:GNAT family N-acetyltransferase n=1 Tax=Nocardioides sp. YR527 TaxID=1881028 RepID=UPI00088C9BE5|nr:GNAT family N-acetyltransferase [Nocardioides sp. YR527]SDK77487.1 Acetyltransferase (GNAT) family protein [Nocardioides sp. YR527]
MSATPIGPSPAGIRQAEPADAPRLREIARAAYARYVERIGLEPAPMGADYEEAIESAEVWVGIVDGDVAGYAVTRHPVGDGVLLENLAVAPGHQERGIGRALIAHVEARAMARGAAYVVESGYRRVFMRKTL